MSINRKYASVTGATGIIGRRIVEQLLFQGYRVKILTRKKQVPTSNIEVIRGDLSDYEVLCSLLENSHSLYHCAAEMHCESLMNETNVNGTLRLLEAANLSEIEYFCYISSAGVIGLTNENNVDELCRCIPQSTYEETKYEAEKIVIKNVGKCRTVILRPTNVVDERNWKTVSDTLGATIYDVIKAIIKGGEHAHIVHAEDVARAAVYLEKNGTIKQNNIFFVSIDNDRNNTFACFRYRLNTKTSLEKIIKNIHLPPGLTYVLRSLFRGPCNKGTIQYDSDKLLRTGFAYKYNVQAIAEKIKSTI